MTSSCTISDEATDSIGGVKPFDNSKEERTLLPYELIRNSNCLESSNILLNSIRNILDPERDVLNDFVFGFENVFIISAG